jgi:HME family heavy-metal exporter
VRGAEATLPADVVVNTNLFQLKGFIDRGIYLSRGLGPRAILVVIVLFLFCSTSAQRSSR